MDTDKTSDDEIIRSCTSTSAQETLQAPAHSPAAENSGDLPRHRMKRQLARALKLNAAQTLRACGNAGPWF
ncbi:hypothetical protein AK812_SmicGene48501 [Symbiodinium microadriaticum]|uniref:Uncharacterized protein n=1 Tax=Symbiodinium microadriaticum TaxID=2951 RepID=A0A1Q9BEH7_SYMMI|nr:hypothetical protein AK812_SmicGene48501 [Symbiodinium microadriaticum]